jgi:phosphoribosylanthranilate isomerase
MLRVKICGITSTEDALVAAECGADVLGFVFAPSPRQITPEQAHDIIGLLPFHVKKVGVFVNESVSKIMMIKTFCDLDMIQLHGDETEDEAALFGSNVIKAVRVGADCPSLEDAYPKATLLLDTYCPDLRGGTGRTFDWRLAVDPAKRRPIILAGGLTPENVAEAVRTVQPYGVDVSGGVESEPRRKDHDKLDRFIRAAKAVERPA